MSCSRRACPAEPCRTDGDPGSLRPSRATPLPSLARGTGRHRERPVTAGGRQRPFERPSGCASGTPSIPPPFSDTAATEIWQALRRSLSPNARLILRVLDEDGAAFTRLLRHYGGQSLRIPRRLPPEEHVLRRTLGTDCLRRLMGPLAERSSMYRAAASCWPPCAASALSGSSAAIPPPELPAAPPCVSWPVRKGSASAASGRYSRPATTCPKPPPPCPACSRNRAIPSSARPIRLPRAARRQSTRAQSGRIVLPPFSRHAAAGKTPCRPRGLPPPALPLLSLPAAADGSLPPA